ncbi:hypothetical protein OB13_09535 [Pontibacter sp. HJ8]
MEEQLDKEMAVFHQVCEVNELEPEVITKEAKTQFPDRFRNGSDAEHLIRTALDYRARTLIKSIEPEAENEDNLQGNAPAYTIDGDPAAPSFVINEEAIRNQYDTEKASKIIDALGQVKLPVTG